MHIHNYSINEREVEWAVTDIPDSGLADHLASYEEYFDEIDSAGSPQCAGGRTNVRSQVREAIKKQLLCLGWDRPMHNRMRSLPNLECNKIITNRISNIAR
jgi:hypothetical protein